jgi:hypothetical protein
MQNAVLSEIADTIHPGIYPIRHAKRQSVSQAVQSKTGAITFSSTGRSGLAIWRENMFNTSKNTTRLVGFSFAVLMAVAINGGMLLKFDSVAHEMAAANNTQTHNVAVLETVTVVGHRV